MLRRALIWVACMWAISAAEYLSDYEVRVPEPPPAWVYGGAYTNRIFAGGMDHWSEIFARWRSSRRWAWQLEAGLNPVREGYQAGWQCHWLPKGNISSRGFEDYVRMGQSVMIHEAGTSHVLSVGYGRDLLPWKTARFGMRLGLHFEFAIWGEEFNRETEGLFGLKENKLARGLLALNLALFLI